MGMITYVMHYVPPLNSAKEQKKTVLPLKNALLQLRNLPIDSKEIYKKYYSYSFVMIQKKNLTYKFNERS